MIQILQGLLTPVIGLIAVYIAYQQWRTNRDRLALDKYDRRMKIFDEVKKLVTIVNCAPEVSIDDLQLFRAATAEADFLFDKDVQAYRDELYRRGLNLWQANQERNDDTGNHDKGEVVRQCDEEVKWFNDQATGAVEVFRPYLDVSGGRPKLFGKLWSKLVG